MFFCLLICLVFCLLCFLDCGKLDLECARALVYSLEKVVYRYTVCRVDVANKNTIKRERPIIFVGVCLRVRISR